MDAQVGGQKGFPQAQLNQLAPKFLHQLTSRELMDALMAADMPMGGSNEQRIERLLSVIQPQDLRAFLPQHVLDRVSPTVGASI
ncbi:hypothetical protein [Nitrospira lenta]|uniref:Uncharacterized protein n=1 Tax=Nitrospira lenta TaxID=1436998 RepID=A0A330L4C7_9BACT|nr:hypothetical protein [Nitrospira lenta]SPP64175.1 hypothetical protein NITLEN_100045 [Nitrospira lenta]